MTPSNKLKQTVYFADTTLKEIFREAHRLDRSQSWIVQQAWMLARAEIMKAPSSSKVLRESLPTKTA